jgi:NAD(P)-dependent dehydrogenase (short-subunit alcohol dehydrogenase family)
VSVWSQHTRWGAEVEKGPTVCREASDGRILNLSPGLARFTPPGYSAYGAAKGGLEVLTRYMANVWGRVRSPYSFSGSWLSV